MPGGGCNVCVCLWQVCTFVELGFEAAGGAVVYQDQLGKLVERLEKVTKKLEGIEVVRAAA